MNGRRTLVLVAALAALLIGGCKTNKQRIDDYGKAMVIGDYSAALNEVAEPAEGAGADELLWRLHAGGAQYLLQNHGETIRQFDRAEDILAKNAAEGVFAQGTDTAFAMMTNDRAFPYAGTGADRVFTCLYKAIDYAAAGDMTATRTELNRAAQHQDNWLFERRKEITAAQEKLKEDAKGYAAKENEGASDDGAQKAEQTVNNALTNASFSATIQSQCGFDPSKDGNLETLARKDYLNVYAEHVTGVFRWLSGEDDAGVYLKEASELYPDNPMLAKDYADFSAGLKPKGAVWVFVEDGMCPTREERRLDLPLVLVPYVNRYVMYAGMALPYLEPRGQGCSTYSVAGSGCDMALSSLADVDALLKTEFDVYFRGALIREITRTVVKIGVQVGLGIAAEHAKSPTNYALTAAQCSVAAYAAAMTQADLRCWTGLPKRVFAARVNRPADGKIVVKGDGANVAEIVLPEGCSMVFVRKTSPGAKPVVKTVLVRN